jgi:hypothetical protein
MVLRVDIFFTLEKGVTSIGQGLAIEIIGKGESEKLKEDRRSI